MGDTCRLSAWVYECAREQYIAQVCMQAIARSMDLYVGSYLLEQQVIAKMNYLLSRHAGSRMWWSTAMSP